jgi:ADP-L-glycero-D-manno-heptose 6-epimerase
MASVIFHATRQIQASGKMNLFQSHREGIAHGHQKRDFVYVKDVVEVCFWLMMERKHSAIYNLGSGEARTFLDLVLSTFSVLGKEPQISFVPTPMEIRESYQYFTEAKMDKLKTAGYPYPFTRLEDGISDYVGQYLQQNKYY